MDKLVNALRGDDEDGAPPKRRQDWGGDNMGGYMKAKVHKLDQQFVEETNEVVADRGRSGQIFQGVVIHVNGYTIPSADELRRLIGQHGGRYQQYYSKSYVTHIIATNLPDSKIRELKGEKVVRPEWIVDSIAHDKLLPTANYLLCSGRKPSQAALKFTRTTTSTDQTQGQASVWMASSKAEATATTTNQTRRYVQDEASVWMASSNAEAATGMAGSGIQRTFAAPSNMITRPVTSENLTQVRGDEMAGAGNDSTNRCTGSTKPQENMKRTSPNKGKRGAPTMPKAGDPNFVSEFYNNSRLHYLSTWGAEFKQFTSQLIKERTAQGLIPAIRTGPGVYGRVIMHIDMDSFFVSVYSRDHPEVVGKPVAVCHAGKAADQSSVVKGLTSPTKAMTSSMSEIASCSYEARASGVRNGMFLGQARKLCPEIVCVPYLFDKYREVSQQLYEILVSYTHDIEAVSCDEAFLDVTHSLDENQDPMALAERIRAKILSVTRCNASAGISSSVLLARMCTRRAKPNGQFYLGPSDDALQFIGCQKARDLPGVGWAMASKLKNLGVETCADLQQLSLQALQKEFGPKTGVALHRSCRGIDDRPLRVERDRKSVSAEINYGIRFTEVTEAVKFIEELAAEVQKRLRDVSLKGRCVTLKLKVRSEGAPMPQKFMGHGICDNIARSATLATPTDDSKVIAKECLSLLRQLKVPAQDFRGLGIQVSKLVNSTTTSKTLFDFMKPGMSRDSSRDGPRDGIRNTTKVSEEHGVADQGEEEIHGGKEAEDLKKSSSSISIVETAEPCISNGDMVLKEDTQPSTNYNHLEDTQFVDNSFCSATNVSVSSKNNRAVDRSGSMPSSPTGSAIRFSPEGSLPPLPKFTPSPADSFRRLQSISVDDPPTGTSGARAEALFLPSPSQIDPSVLEALPADIREGIEKHYAERNQQLNVRGGQISRELFNLPGPCRQTDVEGDQLEPNVPEYRHAILGELPSLSQLDPECFAALPKELQDELKQAYRQQHSTTQRDIKEQASTAQQIVNGKVSGSGRKEMNTITEKSKDEFQERDRVDEEVVQASPAVPQEVSLGGAVSLPDVKTVIREWTYTPVPLDEDVEEVTSYLLQLIESRNLDQVWSVLKYIIRCVRPRGMEDWRDACHAIVARVQAAIIAIYGSRLPIEWSHDVMV